MPTDHIVALLIQERDKLSRAIEALQGTVKRIGRPPKSASSVSPAPVEATHEEPAAPKKRTFTTAQRKKQAAAMRRYWAAKKKAK